MRGPLAHGASSTTAEQRLPKKIGGKYRPIRVLGRGGMSVVYEVEHELTRDRLALKVLKRALDPIGIARFKREARISAYLKSPHVVRVLDADTAPELDGAPFLVMDLLHGADLATISARRPQPAERVVDWLRQAARAIDVGHQSGVIHRDLKPENLFLTRTETAEPFVKVLDFGVARIPLVDESKGTKSGSLVGTPLFMSPEQAAGAPVGPPADVWSVGMCAFRLLSGRDYWVAENVTLLLAKIVYEPVLPPSHRGLQLGDAFDEWFLRSCARDPAARWGSVGHQVEALASALGCAVHSLPMLAPAVRDADVLADDRTVSRVDEGDGGTSSLEPAATSAGTKRFGSGGPLWVAVALGAATLVSLSLPALRSPAREPTANPIEPRHSSAPPPIVGSPAANDAVGSPTSKMDVGTPKPKPSADLTTSERSAPSASAGRLVSRRTRTRVTRVEAAQAASNTAEHGVPEPSGAATEPPPARDPLADPD